MYECANGGAGGQGVVRMLTAPVLCAHVVGGAVRMGLQYSMHTQGVAALAAVHVLPVLVAKYTLCSLYIECIE